MATLSFEEKSNIEIISDKAFYRCISLKSVNFPDSLKEIQSGAFFICGSLDKVSFGDNSHLTTIGTLDESPNFLGAFAGCPFANGINIPNSVTSIGNNAFQDCRPEGSTANSVYTSWTTNQLSNLTLGNTIFNRIGNITINAKNPDGHSHDELLNKYQEIFTTEKTGATSITINVDPNLQPEPITQNFNWAILLGSIFSVIFASGLAATFGIYLKEKQSKTDK